MHTDAFTTSPAFTTAAPSTEVYIRVNQDDDASRIAAVLEALGYRVMRELDEGDAPARLEWAVSRLARRNKLTSREQDILALVLEGLDNERVGRRLSISRATVKWHMHNLFAKTNTGNREALLRLALQLGPAAGSGAAITHEPAQRPVATHTTTPAQPKAPMPSMSRPVQRASSPDVTASIDFGQPHVPSAEAIPSKSWF